MTYASRNLEITKR